MTLPRVAPKQREGRLQECERSDQVDGQHPLELVERVVGQSWLWRWAEGAGIVDDEIQSADFVRGVDQRGAVCRVGDVAGDPADDLTVRGRP